jgi:hypothetical protein
MLKLHPTFLHVRASPVCPHCFGAPNIPLLQRRDCACMRGTTSANHPQKCAQPPQHPRLSVLDDAWKPTNHQETMWANTKSSKLVVHHNIGTGHNILNQNNKQFPLQNHISTHTITTIQLNNTNCNGNYSWASIWCDVQGVRHWRIIQAMFNSCMSNCSWWLALKDEVVNGDNKEQ